jgi:hypothetical protein
LFPSVGTVYSCFADARVTTTVTVAALSVLTGSLVPKSFSVTLRVRISAVSPALRSSSERLPTDDANHNFCASTVSTSSVTLRHGRLGGTLVSGLINREHTRVLQNDLRRRVAFFNLASENDVDVIARQHEAAYAFDVVDANGHGLHPWLDQGRQRGALARSGYLEREHRLVRFDRGQNDAASSGYNVLDFGVSAARQGIGGPGHLLEHRCVELRAKTQRLLCDDDSLRCHLRPVRVEILRSHVRLVVEPDLRDEYASKPKTTANPIMTMVLARTATGLV